MTKFYREQQKKQLTARFCFDVSVRLGKDKSLFLREIDEKIHESEAHESEDEVNDGVPKQCCIKSN